MRIHRREAAVRQTPLPPVRAESQVRRSVRALPFDHRPVVAL